MLRTNLASRPFYNERLVRAGLLLVGLVGLVFTLFNVAQVMSLRARNRELEARVAESTSRAGALRADAQKLRQALNQQDVSAVQAAARQANQLIERRAFSWTELFNHFETTLPPTVRITAVQPQIGDDGRMVIAMTAVSRRVTDLESFIEQLETSGAFSETLTRSAQVEEDGTFRSMIQGFYREASATSPPAPGSPPAASEATGRPR